MSFIIKIKNFLYLRILPVLIFPVSVFIMFFLGKKRLKQLKQKYESKHMAHGTINPIDIFIETCIENGMKYNDIPRLRISYLLQYYRYGNVSAYVISDNEIVLNGYILPYLSKKSLKSLIKHELVHIQQFRNKTMEYSYMFGNKWKGKYIGK